MKGSIVAVIAILAVISVVVQPGQAGRENNPSPACCVGVKAVKGMTHTTADKRACCGCVKATANGYADLKDEEAQSMPAKCGVQLDIPVSRCVDCDKIN